MNKISTRAKIVISLSISLTPINLNLINRIIRTATNDNNPSDSNSTCYWKLGTWNCQPSNFIGSTRILLWITRKVTSASRTAVSKADTHENLMIKYSSP